MAKSGSIIVRGYRKAANFFARPYVLVATVVVVGGLLFFSLNKVYKKPKTSPTSNQAQTTQKTQTEQKANSFDGNYAGSSNTASGLTDASIVIKDSKITGIGTYRAVVMGQSVSAKVNIEGGVMPNGDIMGTFAGSLSVLGQNVPVTGTCSGAVSQNKILAYWSGSAYGKTETGTITLYKK